MKARKRVLFLAALAANRIGGIEGFAAELARQLDRKGWDITICHQSEAQGVVRDFLLAPGNVTLDVMKVQEGIGLGTAREFAGLLRKHRPDALLYTLGGPVRWWPLLAQAAGVRRRVYYDQTSRTASHIGYRAAPHVRLVMRPLQASLCATKFVKACSDQEKIVPPEKSRVIYSAIDNFRDQGDPAEFRSRFQIPADRRIVLQVSWLVPEKGIDVALRAAREVLNVRQDLQFVFCGSGANAAEYESLARELGIEQHVTWTGQLQDLHGSGALRAASIQIQCSQWHEAFCLAVARRHECRIAGRGIAHRGLAGADRARSERVPVRAQRPWRTRSGRGCALGTMRLCDSVWAVPDANVRSPTTTCRAM